MKKRFLEDYFELKRIHDKNVSKNLKSGVIKLMFLRYERIYNAYFLTK